MQPFDRNLDQAKSVDNSEAQIAGCTTEGGAVQMFKIMASFTTRASMKEAFFLSIRKCTRTRAHRRTLHAAQKHLVHAYPESSRSQTRRIRGTRTAVHLPLLSCSRGADRTRGISPPPPKQDFMTPSPPFPPDCPPPGVPCRGAPRPPVPPVSNHTRVMKCTYGDVRTGCGGTGRKQGN